MSVRLVQLSDCHLFDDPAAELRGVVPDDRLRAAVEHIRQHAGQLDRLIVTGDIAHDELAPTYDRFREFVADWLDRTLVIPGNHDNREAMLESFPQQKARLDRVVFSVEVAGWQLIGLDSHVPGQVHGELGDEQLRWLDGELTDRPEKPTLLFLHHHLHDVGSPWLLPIALSDRGRLEEAIRRHPQVRSIFHGHIHQQFEGTLAQATVRSTPAVSFQFRPNTASAEIDPSFQAYRVIDLDGDSLSTRIVRW